MLTRKTVILAKIETEYGTDPTPTPAANAILVKDVDIKPSGELVERDFLRSSLSPLQFVMGMKEVDVTFTTEFKGTGTRGALPAWGWEGTLLRACGLDETITADTKIEYLPVSDSFESVTLYVYKDGIFHKITGCRGTFTINGSVGKYLEVKWTFKGLYVAPVDATPAAQTFSSVIPPLLFSAGLTLDAYSPVATAIEISMNNNLGKRTDLNTATGLREIMITGRKPGGSLDPETVTEATYAFWNKWENATAIALNIGPIGSAQGNIITITAPKLQSEGPSYGDREGLLTYQVPFRLSMNSGDDELKITIT
ncbi:MAG: phage tail tube protein [Thermodesulfobacteriota bacterium]|jgi:hypothetical protein|nr:MAG: phage tail tube protein [Thermodesulfobacteriota bacterium]